MDTHNFLDAVSNKTWILQDTQGKPYNIYYLILYISIIMGLLIFASWILYKACKLKKNNHMFDVDDYLEFKKSEQYNNDAIAEKQSSTPILIPGSNIKYGSIIYGQQSV